MLSSFRGTRRLSHWSSVFTPISSRSYQSSHPLFGDVITEKVPHMGDSISEGDLIEWHKSVGDRVEVDDIVATVETDKVAVEVKATVAGEIVALHAEEGDTLPVGANLFNVEEGDGGAVSAASTDTPAAPSSTEDAAPTTPATPPPSPAAPAATQAPAPSEPAAAPAAPAAAATAPRTAGVRTENAVKMNRMRMRIADRLKDSQNTYAMLTTFQECDMKNLMDLRAKHKDEFLERHGVKLGFMSAFVKASVRALQEQPVVNAVIDGDEILYRDYVDVSVAVATPKGLVVPVLRNCEDMSFADVERSIAELAVKAKNGAISLEDMSGGTFTVSNGGVYGSMMGTPIINPPQSSILGMHSITKRPVVVGPNDEVAVRPMMYLALTYDHRLIDGKEAVTFLRTIKHNIEDPTRLLLDL